MVSLAWFGQARRLLFRVDVDVGLRFRPGSDRSGPSVGDGRRVHAGGSARTKTPLSARSSRRHGQERCLCRFVEFEVALTGGRERRGARRQTDVVEELADGARLRERGNDLHLTAAGWTYRHVILENSFQELGPLDPVSTHADRRPIARVMITLHLCSGQ